MRRTILTTIFSLLILQLSYSQMVGGQIFLQGNYAEIGISQCGVYGALNPPAGYHDNNFTSALGFVADHEKDGWNVNTAPGQPIRCGDYFYPGSPYEAWGIEVNGQQFGNYNLGTTCDNTVGGGIPGAVTSYNAAGGYHSGEWEGDIINATTNLHIAQYTAVIDTELYFSTTICITNNGATPANDVYYLRHVDPDNEEVYSNSFNTMNVVDQNPGGATNNALCSATGLDYGCYLGMLSTGYPDARAFVGGAVGSFPITISDCWNGINGYQTVIGSNNGGMDDCMGITNYWPTIAPGQSVSFTFYYVLDPNAVQTVVNSTQGIEVYLNGNLMTIQGSGNAPGASGCGYVNTTDTLPLRGVYCIGDSALIEIEATQPFTWNWPVSPEINVLDPSGDSVLVFPNPALDSVLYEVPGYTVNGSDTTFVILLLNLVLDKPVADFTYDLGCLDMPTCFYDTSYNNTLNSAIVSYQWDFDEAPLVSSAQDTCVLLDEYYVHNVQLVVETEWGCYDTVVKPVAVLDSIEADFTYLPACKDSLTQFFDATVYTDTTLVDWVWDFGVVPAAGANIQNPTHTYNTVTNYNVTLIVTNAIGCKDTVVKQIAVYPTPTVDFSAVPQMGCAPLTVDFNDLSSADTTDIVAWLWEFGNGDTSSFQNPSYTYLDGQANNPIFWDVTLTVTSEYGCQATMTQPDFIQIAPFPTAEFTISITDPYPTVGNIIQFVDLSYANIISWNWDFGDGNTSTSQYPSHIYNDEDSFTVTLIVQNVDGCFDTIQHTYWVAEDFGCHIPNSFTPGDNELNEIFTAYGTGIKEFTMQIFDRWGNEIYTTSDIINGWNGKQNNGTGSLYPQGVYAYRIYIIDKFGKEHTYLGHVNLLR